ncbi:hypothetical protein [Cochlodiniinecator piscidefendens]|uniref:hypothetical protein n=1 Tax=Cochlodiniinecator piscidefendens TaxID=2715756 RepID=UPI00140E3F0E|nr:hypothetical protein [Cochlodiniinecator piscidefendens]
MKQFFVSLAMLTCLNLPLHAEGENIIIDPPEYGSIDTALGLEHWSRAYEVFSHPRCSNCHVGADNRPMWSGPSYGSARPHGMNINAGESRIGAEHILCSTCHSPNNIDLPHAPPGVTADWRLAPVEAEWFGKSSREVCEQLRDPERNGGRNVLEIAEHLDHDVILHWAWNPGVGRESAPYSLQDHVNDVLAWGAAGTPCPS